MYQLGSSGNSSFSSSKVPSERFHKVVMWALLVSDLKYKGADETC